MKKILLLTLLTLTIPCFGYDEDAVLQECMKQQNYTNSGMISCTYDRAKEYDNLSKGLLKSLKFVITPDSYAKVKKNQDLLNKYILQIDNNEIKALYSAQGTIYPLYASGIILNLSETNFQILEILYSNKLPSREITTNIVSINNMKDKMNEEILKIKQNFTWKEYTKIMQSQYLWQKYQKDIETNICPMFKNKPEIQNYIKKIVWESRIGILKSVNEIYNYK